MLVRGRFNRFLGFFIELKKCIREGFNYFLEKSLKNYFNTILDIRTDIKKQTISNNFFLKRTNLKD